MRNLIERFCLWVLRRVVGTEFFVVPFYMRPYYTKITALCLEEEPQQYGSPDLHGDGYFKTRRVLAKMLRDHPELRDRKRGLLKAILVCSDSISSGRQLQGPLPSSPTTPGSEQVSGQSSVEEVNNQ